MLLYATSNRRHLLPEYFHENEETKYVGEEVHFGESIEEKVRSPSVWSVDFVLPVCARRLPRRSCVMGASSARSFQPTRRSMKRSSVMRSIGRYNEARVLGVSPFSLRAILRGAPFPKNESWPVKW